MGHSKCKETNGGAHRMGLTVIESMWRLLRCSLYHMDDAFYHMCVWRVRRYSNERSWHLSLLACPWIVLFAWTAWNQGRYKQWKWEGVKDGLTGKGVVSMNSDCGTNSNRTADRWVWREYVMTGSQLLNESTLAYWTRDSCFIAGFMKLA